MIGLGIALYLGLYQLRIVPRVWEPFFGAGSEKVLLHSPISRLLPVPDSLLGALGYFADIVLGLTGGRQRWRAHPWLVMVFGAVVLGMAIVSVALIMCQALLVHAWCSFCLASALVSFIILPLTLRELQASLKFLSRQRQAVSSQGLRPRST